MIPTHVALGVFIAAMIVCRILQERALRRLSTDAKGRLVEAFSDYRMIALLPLAAAAGLYFLMTGLDALTATTVTMLFVPASLAFAAVMQVLVYRKLRALEVDREYLRTYSVCRAVMLVAFVVLLLGL